MLERRLRTVTNSARFAIDARAIDFPRKLLAHSQHVGGGRGDRRLTRVLPTPGGGLASQPLMGPRFFGVPPQLFAINKTIVRPRSPQMAVTVARRPNSGNVTVLTAAARDTGNPPRRDAWSAYM